MRALLVFSCLSVSAAQDKAANPLITAICGKTEAELRAVVKGAADRGKPLEVSADADKDTLAAAIYESAKAERPDAGMPAWPGCQGVPAAKAAESATQQPAEAWTKMVDFLFKTQDKDKDGKLLKKGIIMTQYLNKVLRECETTFVA